MLGCWDHPRLNGKLAGTGKRYTPPPPPPRHVFFLFLCLLTVEFCSFRLHSFHGKIHATGCSNALSPHAAVATGFPWLSPSPCSCHALPGVQPWPDRPAWTGLGLLCLNKAYPVLPLQTLKEYWDLVTLGGRERAFIIFMWHFKAGDSSLARRQRPALGINGRTPFNH